MAHGSPDYGPRRPLTVVYPIGDMGELAARLGSNALFDRRGHTLWFDDFGDTITKWEIDTTGAGGAVELSTARVHIGTKSARLTPGSAAGNRAGVKKKLGAIQPTKIGFGLAVSICDTHKEHVLEIEYYDGYLYHFAAIRYDHNLSVLQYQNTDEAFVTFASNIALHDYQSLFYNFKLVIDLNSKKYTRFLTDSKEYDLSSYSYATLTSASTPLLICTYRVYNHAIGNTHSYLDSVRITQNE